MDSDSETDRGRWAMDSDSETPGVGQMTAASRAFPIRLPLGHSAVRPALLALSGGHRH